MLQYVLASESIFRGIVLSISFCRRDLLGARSLSFEQAESAATSYLPVKLHTVSVICDMWNVFEAAESYLEGDGDGCLISLSAGI